MPPTPNQPNVTDTDLARARSPYTTKEKVARVLWSLLGAPVFRLTFHNWYALRAALLRLFGATIAGHVRLRPSVRIEQPWNLTIGPNTAVGDRAILYCLGPITLGRNVSISQQAHLCAGTHDHTHPDLPLLRPPITVEDEVWIAADAFVGPSVTVRTGAVVGARAVLVKDADPWTIYAGNPARPIKPRPTPNQ
ncbi:MAG: putative colanic acid biosynthesis acetyltransferase [Planctomycetota bacterium]